MSRTYAIQRWDAVQQTPHSTHVQPVLYVVPDEELSQLVSEKSKIALKIQGTGYNLYDQKLVYATVQPTALTGGQRPNFAHNTGWMTLVPGMDWQGYPWANGTVEVLDFAEWSPPEQASIHHRLSKGVQKRQVGEIQASGIEMVVAGLIVLLMIYAAARLLQALRR